MEFFQEQAFTAFLAIVLFYLVGKVYSFAVCSSIPDRGTVACCVNEVPVAKEGILDEGLRVKKGKGIRKVKFVDDDVIKRVEIYEGSENIVLLDDSTSDGEANVVEKSVGEESSERVGTKVATEKQCLEVGGLNDDDLQDNFLVKVDMLTENESTGDKIGMIFGVEETTLDGSNPKSLIFDQQKNDVMIGGSDELVTHTRRETERLGSGEIKGLITRDMEEETEIEQKKNKLVNQTEENTVLDCGKNVGLAPNTVEKKEDINESAGDGDEDWEGIERSELEKVFAEGVNYVEYGGKGKEMNRRKISKLGSDVQMQLYGLHKFAVEGPCHEPQPMALMVSARAKWNAWQRLGSISQEAAMEQYIRLLSDSIPGWTNDYAADDDVPGSKLETEDRAHLQEINRYPLLSDNLSSNVCTDQCSGGQDDVA